MISAMKIPTAVIVSTGMLFAETYYPSPESADGWRRCRNDNDVRTKAGMDRSA